MKDRVPKQVAMNALASTIGASPALAKKIEARVMLLARMGFPAGANYGRGYRGGYDASHFWQLVLIFQLLRLGVSVGRAIELVNASWAIARSAVTFKLSTSPQDQQLTFYWLIEAAGLLEFGPFMDEGTCPDSPIQTIALRPDQPLQVAIDERKRLSVISASAIIATAMDEIRASTSAEDYEAIRAASCEQSAAELLRNHLLGR